MALVRAMGLDDPWFIAATQVASPDSTGCVMPGTALLGAFADAPKKNSVVFEPHLQYQSGLEGLALWRRGSFP